MISDDLTDKRILLMAMATKVSTCLYKQMANIMLK